MDILKLTYDEAEEFYNSKQKLYEPLWRQQEKDLYTFLKEQNDPDLTEEGESNPLGTLFCRMAMMENTNFTDEFVYEVERKFVKILPTH